MAPLESSGWTFQIRARAFLIFSHQILIFSYSLVESLVYTHSLVALTYFWCLFVFDFFSVFHISSFSSYSQGLTIPAGCPLPALPFELGHSIVENCCQLVFVCLHFEDWWWWPMVVVFLCRTIIRSTCVFFPSFLILPLFSHSWTISNSTHHTHAHITSECQTSVPLSPHLWATPSLSLSLWFLISSCWCPMTSICSTTRLCEHFSECRFLSRYFSSHWQCVYVYHRPIPSHVGEF